MAAQSWPTLPSVFASADGVMWIGWKDSDCLIGAKLIGVLCYGAAEKSFAYSRPIKKIPEFWEKYALFGRCAIDPDHTMGFLGDDLRWSSGPLRRSCNWCGNFTQTLKRWTVTEERTAWVATTESGK